MVLELILELVNQPINQTIKHPHTQGTTSANNKQIQSEYHLREAAIVEEWRGWDGLVDGVDGEGLGCVTHSIFPSVMTPCGAHKGKSMMRTKVASSQGRSPAAAAPFCSPNRSFQETP